MDPRAGYDPLPSTRKRNMDHVSHDPKTKQDTARILVMPASTRELSLNQALGRLLTQRILAAGTQAMLIDLVDFPMPMYNGDDEQRDGVPDTASQLVDLVKTADVLILVSPEYNGSFPALFKNTYDWMSRVDRRCLVGVTVMLASAVSGERGGRRGLDMLRTFMANVHATVPEVMLAAGSLSVDKDRNSVGVDEAAVTTFVHHAVAASRTHRAT